jgi:uncharacterized protein
VVIVDMLNSYPNRCDPRQGACVDQCHTAARRIEAAKTLNRRAEVVIAVTAALHYDAAGPTDVCCGRAPRVPWRPSRPGRLRKDREMTVDFSLLDRPDILSMMFYPRADHSSGPAESEDLLIAVADGVSVHARFHPHAQDAPSVLFFHGNGEVVADYDDIAPVYHHFGMNLVVADYRGYGRSGGRPSFSTMMADTHAVKAACFARWDVAGYTGPRFLMGRSLGALSAVELAATDADGLHGLILESGAAGIRGWNRFARAGDDPDAWQALERAQRERFSSITLPLLSIHGEWDELIPVETAVEVQEAIGSVEKELVVIPGAGHNDLMAAGLHQYFEALAAFVARHGGHS